MDDDAIELPAYLSAYERELEAWRTMRNTPMPHPAVPRIEPSERMMMPMRDGVRLYTELFLPAGASAGSEAVGWPTVLIRTPYPDSTFPFSARPIELFRGAGYAVAVQSCRGTWRSEGRFRFWQNEPEDGYDCIEWIARQVWSNGKVGMYGSSYLGSVQWLAARLRPPHLTCIAPQSPAGMYFYETPYIGGVFFKRHLLTWPRLITRHAWDDLGFDWSASWDDEPLVPRSALSVAMAQRPNVEVLQRWHERDADLAQALEEMMQHPVIDAWWNRIMLTPEAAAAIDIPVLTITGFHDGDQAGALYNWEQIERHEGIARTRRHLLVGPWRHSQMSTGKTAPMGEVVFDANADISLPKTVLRFFNAYMKEDAAARERLPQRCRLYISGDGRWHECERYPPETAGDVRIFLKSAGRANSIFGDGGLSFEGAPAAAPPDAIPASAVLPVPVVGPGEDARAGETRFDVLIYTSAPLSEDLTVLGPVRAELFVAVDAPDCDVVVRIEDVWEDERAINMTGEFGFGSFRARYRQGFEREVPLEPNRPERLAFHVCHMGHQFKKGHRIRVAICATAAGVLEPNHHSGEPVATAVARRTVVQRIYHDAERPSCVVLPVLGRGGESADR